MQLSNSGSVSVNGALPVVIEQAGENAAFQYLLYRDATQQPHYTLQDLSDLEEKLNASLDLLLLADSLGWDVCLAAFEEYDEGDPEDAGELFTLAWLAWSSGQSTRIDYVLGVLQATPVYTDVVADAIAWLMPEQSRPVVSALLLRQEDEMLRLALNVARQQDIILDSTWYAQALTSGRPELIAEACRASSPASHPEWEHDGVAQQLLTTPQTLFWRAYSQAQQGDALALDILQQLVRQAGAEYPRLEYQLLYALVNLQPPDQVHRMIKQFVSEEHGLRPALIAMGGLGDPVYVPTMLEMMRIPELARVAGEAMSMLTGVDIAYQDLDAEPDETAELEPSDDAEDEQVALDPDEALPWPAREKIQPWWQAQAKDYSAGQRYLLGRSLRQSTIAYALKEGYQRQRLSAAFAMQSLMPGIGLFDVERRPLRQKQQLENWM